MERAVIDVFQTVREPDVYALFGSDRRLRRSCPPEDDRTDCNEPVPEIPFASFGSSCRPGQHVAGIQMAGEPAYAAQLVIPLDITAQDSAPRSGNCKGYWNNKQAARSPGSH
jgi:hypothetical protein